MPLPVPLHAVLGGRYRLDAVLGRGGFGAVYQATQLDIGRSVAIKVLHAHESTPEALVRFEREARATGSLGHPHIVQVTDFQSNPVPFLVMELLPGKSLAEVLQVETRLAVPRAVRLMVQALAALAATHRIGVVHRDIKPANLMLVPTATGEENLKVLDFGVAKELAAGGTYATASGQVLGTLGYMAPEQALGTGVGPRTDVYSVATVLYRALSGDRPYGEARGADLVRLLVTNVPFAPLGRRAPHVPAALCQLVDRALATDPLLRPPSAEAFAAELAQSIGMPVPPWAQGAAPSQPRLAPMPPSSAPQLSMRPPAQLPLPPTQSQTLAAPTPARNGGLNPAILVGGAVLGTLLVVGLAAAGYVLYARHASQPAPVSSTSARPGPSAPDPAPSAAAAVASSDSALSPSLPADASTAPRAMPATSAAPARSAKAAPSASASSSAQPASSSAQPSGMSRSCLCRDTTGNAMCLFSKGLGCTCFSGGQFVCSAAIPGSGCIAVSARDQVPGGACGGRSKTGAPLQGSWICNACNPNIDIYGPGVHGAPCKGFHRNSGAPTPGKFDCKFSEN